MRKLILTLAAAAAVAVSCGPAVQLTRGSQYPGMYEEQPVTLLIMPPINNSSSVEAKELLYTSISRPIVDAGYYVIPPFMSMDILQRESAYDAEMFAEGPLEAFGRFFGADAVVFSEINTWTKKGFGIETNIRYFIRSVKTGKILFDKTCDLYLDLSVNSSNNSLLGLLVDLAASAVNTALTQNIEAARQANVIIFRDLPYGKYHPMYQQDQEMAADPKETRHVVK